MPKPAATEKKQSWFKRHKIITIVLGIFVLLCIASALGNDTPQNNTASDTVSSAKAPAPQSKASPASTKTTTSKSAPKPTPKPAPAQPAVPAEYKAALNSATSYANTMNMSKQAIYDQLTSSYGDQFSAAAAQYAIDNVQADWDANALASAKQYQSQENMSPAAIHDQLTSSYGDQFTEAQADYAIQHLND